tara:strand:- start:2659 stop:3165 length:507 start_codon:yes stop_codon:yes gene_type:complete
MATFPSIVPTTRLYTPGDFPSAIQQSSNGTTTGFRRGNRRINQTLQLSFDNLTESQVTSIRDHYDGQNGSFERFFLSSSTWSGYNSPPVALVSDFAWLYATPPTISDGITSKWNVEIELISVPIDLGEILIDAGDSTTIARTYIIDALTSSTTPTRQNIINSGTSLLA